jgi:hypothetical protein
VAALVFGAPGAHGNGKEGNGFSVVCWCYWAEEEGERSRHEHGIQWQ